MDILSVCVLFADIYIYTNVKRYKYIFIYLYM